MSHHLYAYGTLQVPAIVAQIVGRELVGSPARLRGYACYRVIDRPYPAIVAEPEGEVEGVVYPGLEAAEIERLDAYEGELYERRALTIQVGELSVWACTYVLRPEHIARLSREPWDLARFEQDHLASYLARMARTAQAP